jgi:hypothetical protein
MTLRRELERLLMELITSNTQSPCLAYLTIQREILKLVYGSFQRKLPLARQRIELTARETSVELRPVFQSITEKTERLVRKQLHALAQKGHSPTASKYCILERWISNLS